MSRSRVYTDRISKETYESQKEHYTNTMVTQLIDNIRREPQIAKNAVHYQREHLLEAKNEVLWRVLFDLALGIYVFFLVQTVKLPLQFPEGSGEQFGESSLNLRNRLPKFLCEDNHFNQFMETLPRAVSFVTVIFLTWIAKTAMKTLSIAKKLNNYERLLKMSLDGFFKVLIFFVATSIGLLALSSPHIDDTKKHYCVKLPTDEIQSITLPSVQSFFTGLFVVSLKQMSASPSIIAPLLKNNWIFFGMVACLFCTYLFARSLLHFNAEKHFAGLAVFIPSLIFVQLIGWHDVAAGEFLVVAFVFSRAVSSFVRWLSVRNSQLQADNVSRQRTLLELSDDTPGRLVDEDDEDEESEEETNNHSNNYEQ
eukprot:TRINITY_DN5960_c0_g1_i1.p1 TRINITY_DN5960_c0_g1~~TRINITY_DN5960_c0_g1_i1.p1  ORF type:complete len:367 (-),score=103.73 TRINITY_DN5960_c0_g1_i1:160-1260(-)